MAIDMAVRVLNITTLAVSVLSFCGSILLIIGNGSLEKTNAFLNKLIVSVGPSIKKGDASIANVDSWLIKRSRLVGAVALVLSVILVVNLYNHVI